MSANFILEMEGESIYVISMDGGSLFVQYLYAALYRVTWGTLSLLVYNMIGQVFAYNYLL